MTDKTRQPDILDCLREAVNTPRPGTADSDINVFALPVTLTYGVVERAIREIERLRRLAGAVSDGESFGALRLAARNPK